MGYIPRKYGWIRDAPKMHRPKYELRRKVGPQDRAPVIDFRQNVLLGMPPVLDQGNIGACTANSIAGIIRYLQMRLKLPRIFTPSRLAFYYWERERNNSVGTDAGATIEDQMAIAKTVGAPDEALWPYDTSKFTVAPPPMVRAAAAHNKVPGVQEFEIDTGINGIMDSLEQGFPVSIGIIVYKSFESQEVAHNGIVPMPSLGGSRSWFSFWRKAAEEIAGGHAVWMCGYNQSTTPTAWGVPPRSGICMNSWDKVWGDNGAFYLSFDYLNDPNLAGPFYSVQSVRQT